MLIEPRCFDDERGFFLESFQAERYQEAGISDTFVQHNHSRSAAGVLRGLHYQVQRPQAQIVTIMRGRIFDVAVDLRPASPTFGKYVGVELSDKGPRQLYMAPGFAHGFCVLSEWADIHYAVSRCYDHSDEGGVVWNDPDIKIVWPITNPRLSPRDAAFPKLCDLGLDCLPHDPAVELRASPNAIPTPQKPVNIWEGVYATFTEAAGDKTVFEGEVWLDKVVKRAQATLAATQGYATIAPAAATTDYALPFVAALLARRGRTLRILDFGGGMATSFLPLTAMLPADHPIEYVVVENPTVCKAGENFFKGQTRIRFQEDVPGPEESYDIIHCGSSLHYVDDWKGMLDRLLSIKPEYILFADLPAADNQTFVTTQMFHGQRIPVRFWNLEEFVSAVEEFGYELLFKARYKDHHLDLGEELPTQHFDPVHRLGYVSQLIFQRVINNDREQSH